MPVGIGKPETVVAAEVLGYPWRCGDVALELTVCVVDVFKNEFTDNAICNGKEGIAASKTTGGTQLVAVLEEDQPGLTGGGELI